MINRRHLRIKVMQSAYALLISESDKLDVQERYLTESIEQLHKLYIVQLQLLVTIHQLAKKRFKIAKKNLIPTDSIIVTSPNFINNKLLLQLENSIALQNHSEDKKNLDWKNHIEIIEILWKRIQESSYFEKYASIKNPSYKDDKKILLDIYKKIIAPSEQLYDFYEGQIISWVDDIPFVNTWIVGNITGMKNEFDFIPDRLFKDNADRDFYKSLFRKTVLNFSKYEKDINDNTPNWDSNRITRIDKLLMVMAITEFFHFPSIPTKVSINEYIEIAKDYATSKSSYFINGVLDKLLEDYQKNGKIKKVGRGLL